MFRKLLTTALLLCATVFVSHAKFYAEAAIQQIYIHNGLPCADVLVTLWEDHTADDGTPYHVKRGEARVNIGPGCAGQMVSNPNPNCPPVTFHGGEMYTEETSPVCTSVWLAYPGVADLVDAALDEAYASIPQGKQAPSVGASLKNTPNQLQIMPNPAHDIITIRANAEDLDGAEVRIYDVTGKMMEGGIGRISGSRSTYTYTLSVSTFPQGTYTASLHLKNGEKIITRFTVL